MRITVAADKSDAIIIDPAVLHDRVEVDKFVEQVLIVSEALWPVPDEPSEKEE